MFSRCGRGQLSSMVYHRASSGHSYFPRPFFQLDLTIAFLGLKKMSKRLTRALNTTLRRSRRSSRGEPPAGGLTLCGHVTVFEALLTKGGVGSTLGCLGRGKDFTGRLPSSVRGSRFCSPGAPHGASVFRKHNLQKSCHTSTVL